MQERLDFVVLEGGAAPISSYRAERLRSIAELLRTLSDEESASLCLMLETFAADGYLRRARPFDFGPIKIMAEVISGWDQDGVYEFARAWASTLIAREDGFAWDRCSPEEKRLHYSRIDAELLRRGLEDSADDLSG